MALTKPLKSTARRQLSRAARRYLWAGVVMLSLGGGVQMWHHHRHRVAVGKWRSAHQQRMVALCALLSELEQAESQGVSLKEFERRHPNAQLLRSPAGGGEVSATFTDPAAGASFAIRFREGILTDWRPLSLWALPAPAPRQSGVDRAIAGVQSFAAGWRPGLGVVLWGALLLTCLVWRRYRAAIAELMLAVALLTGVAWLAAPHYDLRDIFRHNMSDEPLFWTGLIVAAGIVVLAVSRRVPPRLVEALCPRCDYDLNGNVSGVCPECGQVIPPSIRSLIRQKSA